MPLNIDPETGIIKDGRFAGRHIDEIMQYTENLERVVGGENPPETPPANTPQPNPPPKTPEQELQERADARIKPLADLTLATALRQEQDDEAAFASSIPDYEEFRDSIKKMKERLPPVARTASGLHKQMYLYLKSQKPEVQATLLGTTPLPTVPPSEPTPAPPAAPGPKAVPPPPSATPTPGARSTPPPAPETKSKLKSNPRVERLAAAMGMSIESYLLQCEGNGMTQEQLDSFGVTKAEAPGRRKSVYDLV